MKISIASDHRGYRLKEHLKSYLREKGYEVVDFGTDSEESTDYPDYIIPCARSVADGEADFGIVICSTGQGSSIAANKVKGVRSALCITPTFARLARQHNDANVLALPADFISLQDAITTVEVFLNTPFEGGRHARRVNKILQYENRRDS